MKEIGVGVCDCENAPPPAQVFVHSILVVAECWIATAMMAVVMMAAAMMDTAMAAAFSNLR